MGNIQFNDGKILFSDSGRIAMDPACCCGEFNCGGCECSDETAHAVAVCTSVGMACYPEDPIDLQVKY